MKAIVAEVDKKRMIVITAAGDFVKIRAKANIGIGDEIEISPRSSYQLYRRAAALAACFIMAVMLTTGVYAYYTPYSYISVDINPSIGLSLNRFERVISVQPLSQDGAAFLESVGDIKNRNAEAAVTTILQNAAAQGYLKEEKEPGVVIVVAAKDDKYKEKLKNDVSSAAKTELSKVSGSPDTIIAAASLEDYKKALEKNASPGKAILVEKIEKLNPEVKPETVKDLSVKETMQLLKELKKQEQKEKKEEQEKDRNKGKSGEKNEDKEEWKENRKQGQKAKETMNTVTPKSVDKSKTDGKGKQEKNNNNQKKEDEKDKKPDQKKDDKKSLKPGKEDKKDEIKGSGEDKSTKDKNNGDANIGDTNAGDDKERDKEDDSQGNSGQKQDKDNGKDKDDKSSGKDKKNSK